MAEAGTRPPLDPIPWPELEGRLVGDEARASAEPSRIESTCDALRAAFSAGADPFDRLRALSAQVALAKGPWRAFLATLRDEFEERHLILVLATVYRAADVSSQAQWEAWLSAFAEAIVRFRLQQAKALCEARLGFEYAQPRAFGAYRRAVGLMLQQRWEEVLDEIGELAARESIGPSIRAGLLAILMQIELVRLENVDRAGVLIEAATGLAPDAPIVLSARADFLLASKRFDEAEACAHRLMEAAPDEAAGWIDMADRCEKDGRSDDVERWTRDAVAHAPGDSLGYERLLALLGGPGALADHADEYVAMQETRRAVDREGEYDQLIMGGDHQAANDRAAAAREAYECAERLQPNWPQAHLSIGNLHRKRGEVEQAEDRGRRALAVDAEHAGTYLYLGSLFEEQERWQDARAVYERFPARPRAWATYARASVGRMLVRLGLREDGERQLLETLRLDPENAHAEQAVHDFAVERYGAGDAAAALRLFGTILEIRGPAFASTVHNNVGNMYFDAKDFVEARVHYERAVATAPQNARYAANLAGALTELGEFDRARGLVETAFALDHDRALRDQKMAQIANDEGNRAFAAGDFDRARLLFTTAADIAPDESIYHSNLATAWENVTAGGLLVALERAAQSLARAVERGATPKVADRLQRVRRRIDMLHRFGTTALEAATPMLPMVIEIASNLVPVVQDGDSGQLSPELNAEVNAVRTRIRESMGVPLPGMRFRGIEAEVPAGTVILHINGIPLAPHRLTESGESGGPTVVQRLMAAVEQGVLANLKELFGIQELFTLLEAEPAANPMDASVDATIVPPLAAVCRALLHEGLPVSPLARIRDTFVGTRARDAVDDPVVRIRQLPEFAALLPRDPSKRALLGTGPKLEDLIRRSLCRQGRQHVLAMHPSACQSVVAAVRGATAATESALVVDDAQVRPFLHRLVEIELPDLPVLARAELATGTSCASGTVELEHDAAESSTIAATTARSLASRGEGVVPAPRALTLTVFVSAALMARAARTSATFFELEHDAMRAALFAELGVMVPPADLRERSDLEGDSVEIRAGDDIVVRFQALDADELLVDDDADHLPLLGIESRKLDDPSVGRKLARVRDTEQNRAALATTGLAVYDAWGHIVLALAATVRRHGALFHDETLAHFGLNLTANNDPDLVRLALVRYTLTQITAVERALLEEGLSIRDTRGILEALLSIEGTLELDERHFIVLQPYDDSLCLSGGAPSVETLSPGALADHVRARMSRYITHKYSNGSGTLQAYLLGPRLEQAIGDSTDDESLARQGSVLRDALRVALHDARSAGSTEAPLAAVLLTTASIRRRVRRLTMDEFPGLAIVSYAELRPDVSIQPIGRVDAAEAAEPAQRVDARIA